MAPPFGDGVPHKDHTFFMSSGRRHLRIGLPVPLKVSPIVLETLQLFCSKGWWFHRRCRSRLLRGALHGVEQQQRKDEHNGPSLQNRNRPGRPDPLV